MAVEQNNSITSATSVDVTKVTSVSVTPSAFVTWEEAIRDFLIHLKATKAPKTVRFYECQLRQLLRWSGENSVPFEGFGKRQLDRYLALRSETVSRTTLRHDAVAAKAFLKWCARNDLIDRSPLADYEIKSAPRRAMYMPTIEDMQKLLKAISTYYDPAQHPEMKNIAWARRNIHRDRNYAIVLLLVDTACRVGEATNLKMSDYQADLLQVTIREAKGKEPRTLPLRPQTVEALSVWMKARAKLMKDVPASDDPGWLFLSEYGTQVETSRFNKALKGITRWAGLSEEISPHSFRRFSLNKMAKTDLYGAQRLAGHKKTETTLLYTKNDADYLRQVHKESGAVDSILENRRNSPPKLRRLA